jgi:hypothetical protein
MQAMLQKSQVAFFTMSASKANVETGAAQEGYRLTIFRRDRMRRE